MKFYIVTLYSFILLASVGFSQSPAKKGLYEKLAEGHDQAKALETVLKTPEKCRASVARRCAFASYIRAIWLRFLL